MVTLHGVLWRFGVVMQWNSVSILAALHITFTAVDGLATEVGTLLRKSVPAMTNKFVYQVLGCFEKDMWCPQFPSGQDQLC